MVKARLKEPKAAQYFVGGRFLQGGGVYELSEEEIKSHTDVIEKVFQQEKEEVIKEDEPKMAKYTEEELMLIVSKEGISGLREIGDEIGVKFRGISEGIQEIMGAQK